MGRLRIKRLNCLALTLTAWVGGWPLATVLYAEEPGSEDAGSWQHGGYLGFTSFAGPNSEGTGGVLTTNTFSGKLNLEYQRGDWRFKSTTLLQADASYLNENLTQGYHFCPEFRQYHNLTSCNEHYEFSFPELFVEHGQESGLKLRAGNQIIHWGTTTFINPTSYFASKSMRDGLSINPEEQGLPVLALEGKRDGIKGTLIVAPWHVPGNMAKRGDFWYPDLQNPVASSTLTEGKTLPTEPANFGKGMRIIRYWDDADISFSVYNGPDNDALMRPMKAIASPSKPLDIAVSPTYEEVTYYGLDFTKPFGDLTLNLEGVYSPDKAGLVTMGGTDALKNYQFPGAFRKSPYSAYSAGIIYLPPVRELIPIYTGKMVWITEWYKAQFLKRGLTQPKGSNLLAVAINNLWQEGKISGTVASIIDTRYAGSRFNQLMANYQWESGLESTMTIAWIDAPLTSNDDWSDTGSMFGAYRNKNFAKLSLTYHF